MYRYTHNQLPSTYWNCFQSNTDNHDRSRNFKPYYIPFARTNNRLVSIKCAGPRHGTVFLPKFVLYPPYSCLNENFLFTFNEETNTVTRGEDHTIIGECDLFISYVIIIMYIIS